MKGKVKELEDLSRHSGQLKEEYAQVKIRLEQAVVWEGRYNEIQRERD